MTRGSAYLICYDITEPKRLIKIHQYLKGEALPLQYSVFFAWFNPCVLRKCVRELELRIDQAFDDVRIYPLPRNLEAFVLGRNALPGGVRLTGSEVATFLRSNVRRPDSEDGTGSGVDPAEPQVVNSVHSRGSLLEVHKGI